MWFSWYIAGILLLATKRYAKKFWVFSHYAHAILGYIVLIVTIIFSFTVLEGHFGHLHNILGIVTLVITILGSLSGSATAGIMKVYNGDKDWSEKERVERVAKIHRWSGYLMLLIGNLAVGSGIAEYYEYRDEDKKQLGPLSLFSFVLFVMVFEAIFRVRNKFSLGHIKTPNVEEGKVEALTPEQVDERVGKGEQLVIFDNLVLNLNGYERVHPGGKFNLIHNLGRDISKFFFGGYNLVQVQGKRPHHHTQPALDIVRTMIVGVIKGQTKVADEKFKVASKGSVNSNTATFTFSGV